MGYALIKNAARRVGLYRQARWVQRHVLDRSSLDRFREECRLYRPFVKPGDLCFDVGANYGLKSEVFRSLGARVVAFEPQPDCFEELRARVPEVLAIRTAVGSAPGTATMFVDPHRTGSSLLPTWRESAQRTIDVPVTTLDEAIRTYGVPAFCKIDVEGFEIEVLRGLSQPIRMISYEFTRGRIGDAMACFDELQRFGPFDVNFTPDDVPRLVSRDWFDPAAARAFLTNGLTDCTWGDVIVRFRT